MTISLEQELVTRRIFTELVSNKVFFPWVQVVEVLMKGNFFVDEIEVKADVMNMLTAKVIIPEKDSRISGNVVYRAGDVQRILLAKRESKQQEKRYGKKPYWNSLAGIMPSLVRQSNKPDNHEFFGDEAVVRVVKAMHELKMYVR